MTNMSQQFLNHFVNKETGVKDGETWHEGGEEAVGDKLKFTGVKERTKGSCNSVYLGRKKCIFAQKKMTESVWQAKEM